MEQSEVSAVNTLAMELAKLTRIREEQQAETLKDQAATLKEHGSLLSSIDKQLSVLVERTSGLAELTKRVTALELWRSRSLGFAAAFMLAGTAIGWAAGQLLAFLHK